MTAAAVATEHPTMVHSAVVRRFVREMGLNPHNVCAMDVRPTYIDVEVYEREPATGNIAILPSGEPATQTITLGVVDR